MYVNSQGVGVGVGDKFFFFWKNFQNEGKPVSVAQLDVPSDWRPGGRGFNPR